MRPPSFPGFDRLYSLSNPCPDAFTGVMTGPLARPGDARRLLRGELGVAPDAPVPVAWAAGATVPGDVVWTATWSEVIVSARIVDVLRRHRLTGWGTYPVRLTGASGAAIPGYVGLSVVGRCGAADPGRSALVMRERPAGWLPFLRGRYFDAATWDGSDLFMERAGGAGDDPAGRGAGCVHATPRVREALAAEGVAGVRFAPLTDWEAPSEAHPELWPTVLALRLARLRATARAHRR